MSSRSSPALPAALQEFRASCELLGTKIYLPNCSQAPQSLAVRAALQAFPNRWAEDVQIHDHGTAAQVEQVLPQPAVASAPPC
ncbi:MAG: hypothetical protein ACLQUY_07235 [Ktedonobacterales bacterium]